MRHTEVFYTPPDRIDQSDGTVEIIDQEAHHIRNVLRHKPGDEIMVVDGCGTAYWVTLINMAPDVIEGQIEKKEQSWGEATIPIKVIVPVLKGQRMDTVIEKGTELGVTGFLVTQTTHSVAKITDNRLDRWRRISLAAMKQCLRSVLPVISQFPNLKAALESGQSANVTMFYADIKGGRLTEIIVAKGEILTTKNTSVIIVVGPEGGFSEEECTLLDAYGAVPFNLGQRRLRSDTAVIAALSQIHAMLR